MRRVCRTQLKQTLQIAVPLVLVALLLLGGTVYYLTRPTEVASLTDPGEQPGIPEALPQEYGYTLYTPQGYNAVVQVCGNPKAMTVTVRYDDGRLASMNYSPHWGFTLNASSVDNGGAQLNTLSNIFPNLLQKILEFYKSGVNPIPVEETIEIAGILDAVVKGMAQPLSWIKIG